MDPILTLIVLIVGLVAIGLLLNKRLADLEGAQKPSEELLEVIKLLQSSSKEDRKVLLKSLTQNTHDLNQRLDAAARVIGKVQKNIGEINDSVFYFVDNAMGSRRR